MTDLEKAARMALEVLEQLQGGCTDSNDGTVEAITVWCPEVITALRQALSDSVEQPLCDHSSTKIRKIRNYPPGSHISPHVSVNPKSIKPWVGLTDAEIARVVSLAGFAPDWAEANIATQIVRVCQDMLMEKNTK